MTYPQRDSPRVQEIIVRAYRGRFELPWSWPSPNRSQIQSAEDKALSTLGPAGNAAGAKSFSGLDLPPAPLMASPCLPIEYEMQPGAFFSSEGCPEDLALPIRVLSG